MTYWITTLLNVDVSLLSKKNTILHYTIITLDAACMTNKANTTGIFDNDNFLVYILRFYCDW